MIAGLDQLDQAARDHLEKLQSWRAKPLEDQARELGLRQPGEFEVRLAMLAELCPHASGPCGCGSGPPRICSHPNEPLEVRRSNCLQCLEGQWWRGEIQIGRT